LARDALILAILGISLQTMMALGGMASFGHAAFFALGAYAAALVHLHWSWGLVPAVCAGTVAAWASAALVGRVMVRSAGVYLAMLSLAFAQVIWAGASQWVALTGGDNGLIGLQLVTEDSRALFLAGLVACALASLVVLRRLSQSSLGAALQAVRDAPDRAAASGLDARTIRYRVFVLSASMAGLAGALFAADKGAVFPTVASVSMSVDALLVVLLGGVHHLLGAVVGSGVLTWTAGELGRGFEYWRGALGVLVMVIMVMAPSGLVGALSTLAGHRRGGPNRGEK
jgi:branched-chain amino acid transport system permease protein